MSAAKAAAQVPWDCGYGDPARPAATDPNERKTHPMILRNRIERIAADHKLADGLTTHAAQIGPFAFEGATLAAADVVAQLHARIAAATAATDAKAALAAAAATAKKELADTRALLLLVGTVLRAQFAKDLTTLTTFGLAPRTRVGPTAAIAAGAVVKAKATRTARGTRGSKQRLRVKAVAVAETPAIAPAPPAVEPQG